MKVRIKPFKLAVAALGIHGGQRTCCSQAQASGSERAVLSKIRGETEDESESEGVVDLLG